MKGLWALSVALAGCGGSMMTPGGTGSPCGAAGGLDACQPVSLGTVSSNGGITDFKVDDTHVYLADESGQIFSLPITGGKGTLLTTVAAAYNRGLTLALDDANVYFASGGLVGKLPKVGGAATTLASGTSPGSGLVIAGSTLYWPESFTGVGQMGAVFGMSTAGGAVSTLATNLKLPAWPATDGVDLFFLAGDAIDKLPLAGGSTTTLVPSGAVPQQIAVGGTSVYWAENDSQVVTCGLCGPPKPPTATDSKVFAVAVTGGSPTLLATGYQINGVAVDGTDIYWFDAHAKTLSVAPVGGGTPTVIATGVESSLALTVDAHAIYWVATTGDVMRMPKSPR